MKLNVAVIFGGPSVEHEISIISANQVINALNKDKYNVIPVYMDKNREFYYSDGYSNLKVFKDMNGAKAMGKLVSFRKVNNAVEMVLVNSGMFKKDVVEKIDVFFPVIHGDGVEGGQIQGYLEILDATFVGPNTKAAAVGQDKVFMKDILKINDIKVVDYCWLYDVDYYNYFEGALDYVEREVRYPVIIKPANLGSSVGIGVADNREELVSRIEEAFRYDEKVIIERMIKNLCEVNRAIMGDASYQKLSAIEEVFQNDEFLSYEDKYQSKGTKSAGMASTKRQIPAELSASIEAQIEEMAIFGFKSLDLSGNVRIDFLIDKNTNEVYVNELNTIPGSLAYYLWEEAGVSFPELCDELIQLAIKKKRDSISKISSFETNILKDFDKKGLKN